MPLIELLIAFLFQINFVADQPSGSNSTTGTSTQNSNTTSPTNPSVAASGCAKGCLICSKDATCLLCDFTKGLYLRADTCSAAASANCEVQGVDGACLLCSPGFYLQSGQCTKVPENYSEDNCDYHDSSLSTCLQCKKDFFNNNGRCGNVINKIANCTVYSSDGGLCLTCANNTAPDLEKKTCSETSKKVTNCRSFGPLTCLACNPGYLLEPNNYLLTAMTDFAGNSSAVLKLFRTESSSFPTCRKIQLQNCEVLERFDRCLTCSSQFFLTADKICQSFPDAPIENCEVYQAADVCQSCAQNFFKTSDGLCQPVTLLLNCKSYSRTLDKICQECQSSFFLSNNACQPRTTSLSIANCQQIFLDRDLCQQCNSGFVLALDFASCLPSVNNCGTNVIVDSKAQCLQCFDGFYLSNDGLCLSGSIDSCAQYSSKDQCANCAEGYYLSDDKSQCLAHNLAERLSCVAFSTLVQNYCEGCAPSQVRFSLENVCLPVEAKIDGCLQYADSQTCLVCNSTLGYLANNKCLTGSIARCLEYSPGTNSCVRCDVDPTSKIAFLPTPSPPTVNNKCLLGNPNVYFNCQEIQPSGDRSCRSCAQGFYPLTLTSSAYQYCLPSDFSGFPEGAKVANCVLFDQETNACRLCKTNASGGFGVVFQGGCQDVCPAGFALESFRFETNRLYSRFVCQPTSYFSPTAFQPLFSIPCFRFEQNAVGQWLCAQCGQGFLSLFDATFHAANANTVAFAYLLTPSPSAYYSPDNQLISVLSCLSGQYNAISSASGTKLTKSSTAKDSDVPDASNCRLLAALSGGSAFYCMQCAFGFSSKMVPTADRTAYMTEKCDLVTDCQVDAWLNGLKWGAAMPFPLDLYLTCHSCAPGQNPSQIPTFGLTSAAVTNITPGIAKGLFGSFGVPNLSTPATTPLFVDSTLFGKQTSCQLPGLTQSRSFPANCGAQAIFIDLAMNIYLTTDANSATNPICVICLPKYKPTYSPTVPAAVVRCDKINFCIASKTFNKCEQCDVGFALKASSAQTVCASSATEFCYSVDDSGNCVICNPGYVLSVDKTCDPVSQYQCTDKGFYTAPVSTDEVKRLHMDGVGCQACTEGSLLASFKTPQTICVQNKLVQSNGADVLSPVSAIFIANCRFYGLSTTGVVICQGCLAGFLPQEDQKKCWVDNLLPKCRIVANGGGRCALCEDLYFYDQQTSLCVRGGIPNCLRYQNAANCALCGVGFVASAIAGGRTLCFDVGSLNCTNMEGVLALQGSLKCLACLPGFFASAQPAFGRFPLKNCLKIPEVPNCVAYSKELDAFNSFLTCAQCAGGFYLDSTVNACRTRAFAVSRCENYTAFNDSCAHCSDGFYLANQGRLCRANPSGISGCEEYQSATLCSRCQPGLFLEENRCLAVNATSLIKNCRYYKSARECLQCNRNFFLALNSCQQSFASNCQQFVDSKTCLSCDKGFGLSSSNGITSCLFVQVKNCEQPNTSSRGPNFTCLKCAPFFFRNSSSLCAAVTTKVSSCKYYQQDGVCSQCTDGQVVSADGQRCLKLAGIGTLLDPNCVAPQTSLSCNTCQLGFFVSNGSCVACQNNTQAQGCWQCNPYNQSQCLICKGDTYQNKDKICVGADYSLLPSNNGTNNSTNGSNGTSAAKIIGLVLPLLLVVVILFFDKKEL